MPVFLVEIEEDVSPSVLNQLIQKHSSGKVYVTYHNNGYSMEKLTVPIKELPPAKGITYAPAIEPNACSVGGS
jgi:hypothetical protein